MGHELRGVSGELGCAADEAQGTGRGDAAGEAQGAAGELGCAGREARPASSGARSTAGTAWTGSSINHTN